MLVAYQRLFELPSALLFFLSTVRAVQLPYTPTRLLKSPQNESVAYIFRTSDTNQTEFGFFDPTSSISDSIDIKTLYDSLPFLKDGNAGTFTSAIAQDGNISVYAGDCADGAKNAELWTFVTNPDDAQGNGTWSKETVNTGASQSSAQLLAGANYLASGISFSSVVGSQPDFYTFGGMCPMSTESDDTAWQSNANYSNLLVTLSDNDGTYDLQAASTGSKPIAEAGFSITGLAPSFSNNSDGTQNLQQSFVMVGGHTQFAFINMSQVALFSLPQGSWNFLPIDQLSTEHTDLALRAESSDVEPRSGHSAVLSADGTKIVIFGGWLGSINTAANPQLAVLNIGAGYGGTSTWSWSFPDITGTQPSALFGHDAMLLDGDVMMITGGYNIQASTSRVRPRADAALSASTQTSFFNITSGAWSSSYAAPTRPQPSTTTTIAEPDTGALHSTGQKVGLGVGLGLGALAVIALLIFYFWYTRRLHRKRDAREKELGRENLAGATRFTGDRIDVTVPGADYYADGPFNEKAMQSYYDMTGQQGWRSTSGHDVERSGLYVDIPSPTRGLRKGTAGRGSYQPTPRYDDKRSSRASGNIPPIEESDEEHMGKSGAIGSLQAYHQKKRSTASAFSNASTLDPFIDPLRSHPTSLLLPDKYEVSTHPAHQIVAQSLRRDLVSAREQGGRVSPTRSDRTSSTLSESTSRSGISARTAGSGPQTGTLVGSLARNLSIRSTGLLNAIGLTATTVDPLKTPRDSPTREDAEYLDRPQTKESHHTDSSNGQSFHSARSRGFDRLRAESEALLGDDAQTPRDINRFASIAYDNATPGHSPMRQDAMPTSARSATFAGGVFGSVRRALGAGVRRQTAGPRSASFTSRTPTFTMRPRSGSGSPVKPKAGALQRSVSDAGAWKARRSGAKDWLGDRYRYGEDWDKDDPGQEDDWDVERAANERNVQVMFTVPRERLRVVNAEVDARSLLSSADEEGLDEQRTREQEAGMKVEKKSEHHGTRTL